ncbi:MAG: TIM barrel protein [Thermoguttaceae bacterium]
MKRGLKLWSINTGTYRQEAVRLYSKCIYEYIELYVLPDSLETLPLWKELEIPFVLHAPHFSHGFNLANPQKAEQNHLIYEQVKAFADALDVAWIIFHGGIDGTVEETVKQLKSYNESRALIENKPLIALPNCVGGTYCRGATLEEIKYIRSETGCGFCLDFGHAVCAANALGKEPYQYIDRFLALQPTMFHLTDIEDMASVYDTHLSLGAGTFDIARTLKRLPDGAWVTFETDKKSQENLDDFEKDMVCLNRLY